MKIFIPIGSFFPNQQDGPSMSLYWLCKGISNDSIEVIVFTTNYDKYQTLKSKIVEYDFGKVYYIKTRFSKFPLRLIYKSLINFHKSDIVIITSLFYPVSSILMVYSFFFNKKVIISPRGELFDNALNWKNRNIKLSFAKLLNFLIKLKPYNYRFHATALEEKETINKIFTSKVAISTIPNYIYLPDQQKKLYQRNYILFLGRIHEDKSLDKLIDAFYLVKEAGDFDNLQLIMTGDANSKYGVELKEYIMRKGLINNIIFTGFVSGNFKNELIANALCTVLISNSENFGNSVLESLCFGTPVITSTGTPWSSVEERKCGYWIKNDPFLIQKKIVELYRMEEFEYINMCENARKYAEEKFSIQKNKSIWLNLFNSL